MAETQKFQFEVTQQASYNELKIQYLIKKLRTTLAVKRLCLENLKNAAEHNNVERIAAWYKKCQKADAEFATALNEIEQIIAKEVR